MLTVCDKIDVFEKHVLDRQLKVGKALGEHFMQDQANDDLAESAFVILSIGLAYFEMIEQFSTGQSSDRQSPAFFQRGFRRVYGSSEVSDADVSRIYSNDAMWDVSHGDAKGSLWPFTSFVLCDCE